MRSPAAAAAEVGVAEGRSAVSMLGLFPLEGSGDGILWNEHI